MDQYFLIIVEKIYIMIYEVSVNQESEKETGIIYFIHQNSKKKLSFSDKLSDKKHKTMNL